MIDFIEYVVAELKHRRLSKDQALHLIRQFSGNIRSGGKASPIHPMLHDNVSDLYQQCYQSSFTGDEFFLAHHQVQIDGVARPVLPGVAYLEMARAALANALPGMCDDLSGDIADHMQNDRHVVLTDVVWQQPMFLAQAHQVTLAMFPSDGALETVAFEIRSDAPAGPVVHCRGLAGLVARVPAAQLDLDMLRQRMRLGRITAGQVYDAYRHMGMQFGPGHQAVEQVWRGEQEALGHLRLPAAIGDTLADYVLHPGLLDGALQASLGLLADLTALPGQPALPFAVDQVRVYAPCQGEMWVWIRHAPGSGADARVTRLDIDVCDDAGRICIALRGFASRTLGAGADLAGVGQMASAEQRIGLVLANPAWQARALVAAPASPLQRQHVLCCLMPGMARRLQAMAPALATRELGVTAMPAGEAGLAEAFGEIALQCFQALLDIIGQRQGTEWIGVLVADDGRDAISLNRLLLALSALLKSAALEHPELHCQLLLLTTSPGSLPGASGALAHAAPEPASAEGPDQAADQAEFATTLLACVNAEAGHSADAIVRYRAGQREVLTLQELPEPDHAPHMAFQEHGIYLITGGLGGLGTLFAQEILRQTAHAQVVLTGRGELAGATSDKFAALVAMAGAARVHYRPLDLSSADQVSALLAQVNADGRLKGIIHSAGMHRDHFLLHKSGAEFVDVLAPKVQGTVNLDQASCAMDLDFFVLFSSGASVKGNAGQADYALANGFLDQFASERNRLVAQGQRHGLSLAINWPLWAEGGMRMPLQDQAAMRAATGMVAMQTENGLRAFYRALAAQQQTVVIEGEQATLRRVLFGTRQAAGERIGPGFGPNDNTAAVAMDVKADRTEKDRAQVSADTASEANQRAAAALAPDAQLPTPDAPAAARISEADLSEATRDYLRRQFAALFKLPVAKVDARAALEKYGIDSILAMDLIRQLEKTFGPLSKTLFFEHQTIDELVGYFLGAHAAQLALLFGRSAPAPQAVPNPVPVRAAAAPAMPAIPARHKAGRRFVRADATTPGEQRLAAHNEPIAIVGLSGRYPESENLDAFWRNLRDGKDCIIEVPKQRWDWRDYYSEDRTAEGCHYSKWGGFIRGVDEFDPLFFNIPPVDAAMIDPQERLFLQHAWMAVEDAGYTRAGLRQHGQHGLSDHGDAGQVGVYVGVMYGEYQLFGAEAALKGKRIGVPVSYASIANRVSYIMNLHGPSMTLDTMCSSSLAAIHIACQDLKQGRTSMAIAGGVNVTIHPNKYLILSAGQFISSDGHCQSFGVGGDGYIAGEGVGAVVLKRLCDAERDGNHIYGVLKGSALNHGGKTNGYSVPNPKAQAAVIALAMQEYGIDARHVSYIEAHGTGTKLGDPIEIAALTQVFRQFTDERQFCALGSAKSNIGHCESAAGIAGLTKVLLQMKHRAIVPSLHSTVLNPYIDFAQSPFHVNQTLRDWEPPLVDGQRVARIAGISSFGAGGANAHLIVQEYSGHDAPAHEASGAPVMIVLSARTAAQLRQKVQDLVSFLGQCTPNLDSMAYTLQTGREAMAMRLALVVDSVAQLQHKLAALLQDDTDIAHCYQGQTDSDGDSMALLSRDDDMQEAIAKWIVNRKLAKLAELWVKGLELDWSAFYTGPRPRLISLPVYPFARERYWIDQSGLAQRFGAGADRLHPLVHENTSDFYTQRYRSTFSGKEFFLLDHQIRIDGTRWQPVLPGVACLEMVRAALALALPTDTAPTLEIRNVAWLQPLVVSGDTRVSLQLAMTQADTVEFAIETGSAEQTRVHCQGQAVLLAAAPREQLDLPAMRARMSATPLAGEAIYPAFQGMGLQYGPSMRCVNTLLRGAPESGESGWQVLAELCLPATDGDNRPAEVGPGWGLHPALLDSALQAALGLVPDLRHLPATPAAPFALDGITVLAPCRARMWAWVRPAVGLTVEPVAVPGQQPSGDGISKIDIDMCDDAGNVCVQLRGLTSRRMAATVQTGVLLATPCWQAIDTALAVAPPAWLSHHVLLCGFAELDEVRLQTALPGIIALQSAAQTGLAARYCSTALTCFGEIQTILRQPPQGPVLFQVVVAEQGDEAVLAGLSGLLATARQENTLLTAQLLLTCHQVDEATLADQLRLAAAHPGHVLHRVMQAGAASVTRADQPALDKDRNAPMPAEARVHQVLGWQMQTMAATRAALPFRTGGVYLITGGLGGLGMLFAQEILHHADQAVVVLTGRAPLRPDQEALLAGRAAAFPGARLVYRQLDLEQATQVQALIDAIGSEFGALHGVLHGAGMTRDSFILHKSSRDFAQVLAPKVTGTVHLDQATQAVALDFFVLFSSLAAALGNSGQADYAAANGFMDQFASWRNRLAAAGQRHGQTLSINWPLWQAGGMQVDDDARAMLERTSGMVPLQTGNGMHALYQGLAMGAGQMLVIEGDLARLQQALRAPLEPALASTQTPDRLAQGTGSGRHSAAAPVAAMSTQIAGAPSGAPLALGDDLPARTQAWLREQFASLLHMPPHEIDPKAALETYGMDSVLLMKLTNQLEKSLGSLSKTLLFEYQTLGKLAAYLAKAFPARVQELTQTALGPKAGGGQAAGSNDTALHQASAPATANAMAAPLARMPGKVRFAAATPVAPVAPVTPDPIAIIGLAGRYPMADDLAQFWENLKQGRDCITDVPVSRWDHAAYFHPGRNQPGTCYGKWGGFIDGIDLFDALFFNISPREAELIDPQERLFLETAWETIEDAGYSKDALASQRVGVYVGAMWGHYELYGVPAGEAGVPSSSFASIANRVSYFFNFQGPSLTLDTMCSSSLTALHLACEALRKGDLDLALAGGVNVCTHPNKYLSLAQGNFASSDGRCRSFGAGGDGYVPGEGVGAVLLKPLQAALRDGDQVYASIRASAINHGGKTNGYTVPNPVAQGDVIRLALQQAQIDPASIAYVETHGTGTALGDPIEINGLVRAFDGDTPTMQRQSCPIGSVKSNIGHLESAAGIAAITKVLLQFKHQQLVPSLHARQLNPHIDFPATPFYVQTALTDWVRTPGQARRVGVSSFGAGGANAHVIVEEFVAAPLAAASGQTEIFVLSAKNRALLQTCVKRMLVFLAQADGVRPGDVAFTLQVGRTPMAERLAVVACSLPELCDKLRQWQQAGSASQLPAGVFSGNIKDDHAASVGLIEGEAGRAFLHATLAERDLAKLARLWLAGVEIDWARLHHDARRVSLPTSPFVRERYWITTPGAVASAANSANQQPGDLMAGGADMLHLRLAWCAADIVAGPVMPGKVLWLANRPNACCASLGDAVMTVHCAMPDGEPDGACFSPLDARQFRFNPRSESDCAALLAHLQAHDALPAAIVQDLTGTDAAPGVSMPSLAGADHAMPPGGHQPGHQLAAELDVGIHALHALCRAILQAKITRAMKLVVLMDEASATPATLALAGYLKTLALENPQFAWKTLICPGNPAQIAHCVEAELSEARFTSGEWRYLASAHESASPGQRQHKRAVNYTPDSLTHTAVKQGGVVLLTGGLGGLGHMFSLHLLQNYAARLVLSGRSALGAAQQARLAELQAHGEVMYVQADVADAAQADALVAAARARFGRIHGVIHAAGVNRDAFVLNKTLADLDAVLAAKVLGAVHLDQATRSEDLDWFVLFSSVAGAFGNPGQADYAFANHFLDAFAQQRQMAVSNGVRHGKTLSINWPLWQEGGMSLSASDMARLAQQTGMVPLPTAAGMAFFETLLQGKETQSIALYGDAVKISACQTGWAAGQTGNAGAAALQERASQAVQVRACGSDTRVNADQADAGALRAATGHYLKTLLGAAIHLPVERIDADEPFESYGVDSIMINRMNAALERDLGTMPKTLFYQYASIEELADFLLGQVPEQLVHLFGQQAARPADDALASAPDAPVPASVDSLRSAEQAARHSPASASRAAGRTEIAIIGVHGLFPHSATLAQYWENLQQGRDLIDEVPASRWDAGWFFDADPNRAADGKIYCKWGGFLQDADQFDAAFFGIAADEARMIDPQERLFMQSVYATLEDAGYTRDSLKQRYPKGKSADVGVFVGVTTHSYHQLTQQEWDRGNMVTPASLPWSIANRVSYFFDFRGPSLPVDTACSSSLVAIALACDSLAQGQCQVALAGGVNLYLHPAKYLSFCQKRMLARDGKCRSFGSGDDGFIPGEGVGTVLLKPLAEAEADRDHIYAVIKGGAWEHAGRANGYSAPNPNSQSALIDQALAHAGVHPESISYVEGHGTGTRLGDNLEVLSMTQAFARHTAKQGFCALGSVKANVGHAESAAGMAGLIKILLQFQHKEIAPTIHSDPANPDIDFAQSPFHLQRQAAPWQVPDGQARRAMINGFGAGGVNACLILDEYTPDRSQVEPRQVEPRQTGPHLLLLSAKTPEQLQARVRQLHDFVAARLAAGADVDFASLCYTLQTGREAMDERLALVVDHAQQMLQELAACLAGTPGQYAIASSKAPGKAAGKKSPLKPTQMADARAQFGARQYGELMALWLGGQVIDWAELTGPGRPARMALPGYPFARVRYWVSEPGPGAAKGGQPGAGEAAIDSSARGEPVLAHAWPESLASGAPLHPLVAQNVSTLRQVCFASQLSGQAYYGRDHQVHGDRFFPGAAYLELACVVGTMGAEAMVTRIEDVVWIAPLRLAGGVQALQTILLPATQGGSEFRIVSCNLDHESVVHAQGRVCYQAQDCAASASVEVAQFKRRANRHVTGAACYQQFTRFGFGYGPCFQTIQELFVGPGFALARLQLASPLQASFDQYVLHPCIIDGALQAVIGVVGSDQTDDPVPHVPFALGAVDILRPLAEHGYALVEPVLMDNPAGDVRRFTIRLLNATGEVLVILRDFSVRALRNG